MTDQPNLAAALVAALADLTVLAKDQTANTGSYSYSYTDIAGVVRATRPVLAEYGLVALTPIHDYGNGLACTVKILHTSGESMDLGPFPFPHGKDAQATGSMVTYHRRYALLSALGMAAGDEDDDGASAQPRQEPVADPRISSKNAQALIAKAEEIGLSVGEVVKLGTEGRTDDPYEVHKTEVRAVKAAMDNLAPAEGETVPA
jgi:hypothetical protein